MLFKHPTSRQFPFDGICEQITRALEARNWKVPGIKIEFRDWGTGEERHNYARMIGGPDFRVTFDVGRDHGVSQINIPRMEINVYSDESGPGFYLYVGDDWERDRKAFECLGKYDSKLKNEPRIYLKHEGACRCDGSVYAHTHRGKRSPLLRHTNDLGREYDPEGDEPREFVTSEIFGKFTDWLSENVLRVIEARPLPDKLIDIFCEEAIPFPSSIGPIFTFGTKYEVERIARGKQDPGKLEPRFRYGLWRSEHGLGEVRPETPIDALCIPGYYRRADRSFTSDSEEFVIRVTPKSANQIFVVDHGAFERAAKKTRSRHHKGYWATDKDLSGWYQAKHHTRIPIKQYDGKFEQPVVLIERELGFDEVEVVSGPHKSR